ncbi:MAG TPA: response regulator [Gaiellaceae bacterium]|nr:response regulator [Gaiellaceae bacterium]
MTTEEERPVVLVVDDEPAIRLLCRVNLEIGGYTVREAGTLDEAREQLAAGPIDVALLDVHIGTERSESLLRELNERSIPVAIVSGSADLSQLKDAGADAVLGKPFTLEDLESTVAQLAAKRGPRL